MKFSKDNNIPIIYKYLKGESSPSELKNAIDLLESPYKNLNLRKTIYEWWNNENELQSQPELENLPGVLDKIHHQINLSKPLPKKRTGTLILKYARVAAVLLIGLVTGLFITHHKKKESVYYTSVTPHGSISMVILPDSSVVYLNSGSKIVYSISGLERNRSVFLDGEAWFDVTETNKNPFVVYTPSYKIKVTGTKFNVKAYKSESKVITTLEDGSVQVLPSLNPDFTETKMLKPGEQFVFDKTKNSFEITKVNTRLFTSWKDNKLIFINMNLSELIVLLERKYGVDITVSDNIVLDFHYDGTIKNETILEVLELLKETLPINYKIEGQKVIIQKK